MVKAGGLVRVPYAGMSQSAQRVTHDRPPQCAPDFASGSWLYFQGTGDALAEE